MASPIGLDERLLGQVLGGGGVEDDGAHRSVHRGIFALVQIAELSDGIKPAGGHATEVKAGRAARTSADRRTDAKEGVALGGAQLELRDDDEPGPLTHAAVG